MRWPFSREAQPAPEPLRLGFALGGGAVRGAAHLGVLSVLERESIRPDVVAGTSAGAIVGAGLAAGLRSEDMLSYFTKARWRDLARPSWGSRLSMLDSNPMGDLLERVVEAHDFSDLKLPFAAVATDILTGTPFTFTEGPLREALMASAAIPGVFEPVRREGLLLVDGGLTQNVPVGAARDLGANFVIAVDVMSRPDGTYEPRDIRDMLLMSLYIVESSVAAGAGADVLLRPELGPVSFSDFSHVSAAYEAGVRSAEEALPALRAQLMAAGGKVPGEAT